MPLEEVRILPGQPSSRRSPLFLPDDLFRLEYGTVNAATRVPDFAVWPFQFLDAGEACADSADHVAIHRNPAF